MNASALAKFSGSAGSSISMLWIQPSSLRLDALSTSAERSTIDLARPTPFTGSDARWRAHSRARATGSSGDLGDEADPFGAPRGDQSTGHDQLARRLNTDGAHHASGAAAVGDDAERYLGESEHAVRRDDAEVARERELERETDAVLRSGGDDRTLEPFDRVEHRLQARVKMTERISRLFWNISINRP